MPTITAEGLADLVVRLIRDAATDAGQRVHGFRDWPITAADTPCVLVGLPKESKRSAGNGLVYYSVLARLPVHLRVSADARLDDRGANDVRAALAVLRRQVERAVINHPDLTACTEDLTQVDWEATVTSAAEHHHGEGLMVLHLLFPQDADDFHDNAAPAVDRLRIVADLASPFDAAGTYPDPQFAEAVAPAPRTTGPDGRIEAVLDLDLTP